MNLIPILPINLKVDLQAELSEQLEIQEVFSFNIGNMKIAVDETTVVSWIIMAAIALIAFLLTRNLKVEGNISKRQLMLELCYEKLEDFFKGILGEKGMGYAPWLMSIGIFIGASNMIGIFGMKPPTKSMQVTAAMAITSIVLVEFAGIKARGIKGHLKSFAKPVWIVAPINVMEIVIKPLSLCMRLFGNIIGAFIIMELIKAIPIFKVGVPVVLGLYFDLFDGFLQAYIFVFLTALYIQEAIEEEEDTPLKKRKEKKSKKAKKAVKKA